MFRVLAVVVVLATVSVFAGCKKETPTTYDCSGYTPTYTADVKPLMDTYCSRSGCHNSTSKEAGKDLSSYAGTKSAAGSSSFLGSMQHLSGYEAMPQGGSKLTDAQLRTIGCWVQNGMPN